MTPQLKFCKVADVKSPTRAHSTDAGIDFFVPNDFIETLLKPGCSILIPSGIKVDVPIGWALVFFNKSGVAVKKNLLVGAEVVDSGYEGQVHIHLINVGTGITTISSGEKIIQGIMLPIGSHFPIETLEEDMWKDSKSDRAEGGFGSSGVK